MAKRRARKKRKSRKKQQHRAWKGKLLVLFLVCLVGYVGYLDFKVRHQFDGKRWSLPARVYARPLELYAGLQLTADQFAAELKALHYRAVHSANKAGEVSRNDRSFQLVTRGFVHADGKDMPQNIRVSFSSSHLAQITLAGSGKPVSLVRLDPVLVGSFYPAHNEDRVLVRLEEVPASLVDALIAIEDRKFYSHLGISPMGILRALVANIRAGGVVQGGSTLTQQLVKNFFLSNERSITRKLNEAIMALLLEFHYEKDDILESYLNEVYLGQDGSRAVHGFGLASHFYFERPLNELTIDQMALLVGMVKGPSYYNPHRHPERARDRRNLVLDVMTDLKLLAAVEARRGRNRALGVTAFRRKAINTFPAFLELVKRQLRRDYRDEDITSEGLRIFTTLDPQVQWQLEKTVKTRLYAIEQSRGIEKDSLQAAVVVTSVQGGEVLALAGGRDGKFAGFNRALDAKRPVGSVIKPAVYLTALEKPREYTLATLLDDSPLTYTSSTGAVWEPRNYDKQFHGVIPLYSALTHSYNVTTARLGLDLGIKSIISTLRRLGVDHDFRALPSLVLGAVDLSPLQVTQMYQTLASGGFRSPLRAIRAVLASDQTPLQSYPLRVEAAVKPEHAYLINTALRRVVTEGTARSLSHVLPAYWDIAGKTGTTNDLRDSWFAGYTADRLGVVWIGRDDNASTGLTGSSGALTVWRDLFSTFGEPAPMLPPGELIEIVWVDPVTGLRADEGCRDAVQLPFVQGSSPQVAAPCAHGGSQIKKSVDWFKELFE